MTDDQAAAAGIRVTRAVDLSRRTGQSEGALRMVGVDAERTGAARIWMGKVSNEPGMRSVPHHHGEAETAGYVLSGGARIYWGENFAEYVDLHAGDFCYVPPYLPHIEANISDTEPLVFLTCRTPDNIVVNLEDVELDPTDDA